MKSALIESLVLLSDRYCAASGRSRSFAGKAIFGRASLFDDLEQGVRDVSTGTYERAVEWFSANWPDGADWPAGVARPEPARESAA